MSMTYLSVKRSVIRALSREVYDDIVSYLKDDPPRLWGSQKPSGFLEKMATLGLHKKLTATGYNKLNDDIDIGSKLDSKSFHHNWQVI